MTFLLGNIFSLSVSWMNPPLIVSDTVLPATHVLKLRLSSESLAPFGGLLKSYNPSLDITGVSEKNNLGVLTSKMFDLSDSKNSLNSLFIMAYKRFLLSTTFSFTPGLCYLFSQAGKFKDSSSDVAASLILNYKPTDKLTITNSFLFTKISKHTLTPDLVNRHSMEYKFRYLSANIFLWYNTKVFDKNWHFSVYPHLVFSSFEVVKNFPMQAMIGYYMLIKSNVESYLDRKLIISLLIPLSLEKNINK